jgi:hypothetical protein
LPLKSKIPRNKLNWDLKYLYNENYKTSNKEVEEDTGRWKTSYHSWIGRINIVKLALLLKVIYRFYVIPINILMPFSQK